MPSRWLPVIFVALTVILGSPANAERNLTRPPGTTRYAPMLKWLQDLQEYDHSSGKGRMALSSIGSSVEGRGLWMVTLSDPANVSADVPKVFFLCRQHGHEPASTQGAIRFIQKLVCADTDSPLAQCLQHATIYIVPMANPDGAERFVRHNAHNVDLNRDWLRQTQPETKAIVRAIYSIRPNYITDQHELFPDDIRGDFTETAGPEAGVPSTVAENCGDLGNIVKLSMRTCGFPVRSVLIKDHHPARLAHRYGNIVAGIPTILFETNRNGRARTVSMRADAHEHFMEIVLRDVSGQRGDLIAEAQAAGVIPASHAPVNAAGQTPIASEPDEPSADSAPQSGDSDSDSQ